LLLSSLKDEDKRHVGMNCYYHH